MPRLSPLLLVGLLGACAPPAAPRAATVDPGTLTSSLAAAFAEEARGNPSTATDRYLDLVDTSVRAPADAWQLAVASAALDALVFRSVSALASVTPDTALVYRTLDRSLTRAESQGPGEGQAGSVAERLADSYRRAGGPFARGLIAEALTDLAEHRGDVNDAARWREASGCAREATVLGPLDWAPVTGVRAPDALAPYDAPIAADYVGPGGFAPRLAPVLERGRGCALDLSTQSSNPGVRDVVVDLVLRRPGRIGVALRSASTATLRAGGRLVIDRPYELGGMDVARYAWVDAPAGRLRLVARVGMDQEGGSVRLSAWDDEGQPVPMRAPRPGEAATVAATAGEEVPYPAAHTPAEQLAVALAALAFRDPHTAEYLLEHEATREAAPPDLALAYGRAVEEARDLSLVHRTERARTAYERVLASWPGAWEAVIAHAWLAGTKRGPGDARFAQLEDLAALRAHVEPALAPVVDAFELAASGREHLWDRARAADDRLRTTLGASALYAEVARVAFERSPADLATYDCAVHPGSPRPRGSLACYHSLRAAGDLRGGLTELERLRAVRGGVDLFLRQTLRDALVLGDHDGVERALHDMFPAEVTLSDVYALASLDPTRGTPAPETRERLRALIATAHDAPMGIAPLLRALRDDPTARFAGVAESAVNEDRARPVLPGAATAILRHAERYDIAPSGVVHAVVFDVRRVSGTTDVEENAQVSPPQLQGRTALRVLRRRVLKHDGRVVEPDPNPGASQGHADLAQLEAGDVVEAIYEGWSVPIETGEIGIDTIDLLPTRTAVHEATVEIHIPTGPRFTLWSHPILGPPATEAAAGETVLRWSLRDHAARRVEDATPKMDRSVAVSLSTARWSELARGLGEAVAARVDHDPEVRTWAEAIARAAGASTDRAKVDAIVAAAGMAVKEGDAGDLSDLLYGHATGPQSTTARAILSDHEGSRTWLVVRALRELGVASEVVVAESEPFSASPDFPPHLGRFVHPLAIAHVRTDAATSALVDVAIDADVSGPPLPAGHISPELRGRQALHEDGTIAPLSVTSGDDGRDEVDERLAVDDQGDARGTFTMILRGRDAQEIAEVLQRAVGDQRERSLRDIVLAWVPFANVDSIGLSSSEGSWQVAVRADITIPGYAQAEGRRTAEGATWVLPGLEPIHFVYPRGASSTLSARYATEGTRESALAISHAVQYHAHRRVELPARARVVRSPVPFEVAGGPLSASRRLGLIGGKSQVVEDDFTLGVPTGTVPADGYARFVSDARHADDAFLATTRFLAPKPAPTRAP